MTGRKWIRQIVFPLIAALIWGTAFVAMQNGSRLLPPFLFNTLRSAIAVAVLTPVACVLRARGRASRGGARATDRRALLTGGALMGLTLAVAVNLQQIGVAGTAIGKAGFISSSYVVLVPVLGLFLKRRPELPVWFSVLLALAGLYLLCLRPGEDLFADFRPTDLALIACAVFYALQIHVIDRYVQRADAVWLTVIQFAVASACSAVLAALFEPVVWADILRCAGPLLYAGVMSSGVGYTLQILAQKDSDPTVVTLLFSLESVFSALAGALILGDRLSGRERLGCAVIFTAVVLAQLPWKRWEHQRKK